MDCKYISGLQLYPVYEALLIEFSVEKPKLSYELSETFSFEINDS